MCKYPTKYLLSKIITFLLISGYAPLNLNLSAFHHVYNLSCTRLGLRTLKLPPKHLQKHVGVFSVKIEINFA